MNQIRSALDAGPPVLVGNPPLPPAHVPAALVLPTSGSIGGMGRYVWLSADALRASAHATFEALHGPGQWALVLPTDHISGIQVVVRSVLAGFEPSQDSDIVRAIAPLSFDHPRYISIVPTHLVRAFESDDAGMRDALASMDAVLVGGAALSAPIRQRALDAGIRVVTTYGMTETAGGCVYNRAPLPSVDVKVVEGRIHLAGPMLAGGYLDAGPSPAPAGSAPAWSGRSPAPAGSDQSRPAEFYTENGKRWFMTSDLGEITPDGLQILGRADQAINSGGVKIHPAHVEQMLREHIPEVMVLGVPDEEWGEIVTVIVEDPSITLAQVRHWCGSGPSAPRGLVHIDTFPRLGIGKLNRKKLHEIAAQAHAANEVQRWG